MTEVYIGLAGIQAGLVAVFLASTFVLAQMARASFSLATPSFLFRPIRIWAFLVGGAGIIVFAMACAIRSALPKVDALPGNWRTDIYIDSPWPALGIGASLLLTALLAAWFLKGFVDALKGPGMITAMAEQVDMTAWSRWIHSKDVSDSERSAWHGPAKGELDQLAPLFEAAQLAVREGRLYLPDRVLAEVHLLIARLASYREGPHDGLSADTIVRVALPHLNDLIGTASNVSAESQVEIGLEHMASLAIDPDTAGSGQVAVRLSYEISIWASRFIDMGQDTNAVTAIRQLRSIARYASESEDWETFSDVALALGKVGEELAANLRDEMERLIPAGFTESRYDDPLSALEEAMEQVIDEITDYRRGVKGDIHQSRLVLDALLVCCSSFLKSQPYGIRADHAGAAFARYMGYLGIAGARCVREDVAVMVVYEMEQLYQLPNATPEKAKHFVESACAASFEMGIYVEANRALSKTTAPKVGTDLRDHLAQVCALAGSAALSEAKIIGLYQSGLTPQVEDQAKADFIARIEARPEFRRPKVTPTTGRRWPYGWCHPSCRP